MWRCPDPTCGATMGEFEAACELCSTPRPGKSSAATSRLCPIDRAPLMANGWCPVGEGYPGTLNCPHVCPACRQGLSWEGKCFTCFGAKGSFDRSTWRTTGPRHEHVGGHYRAVKEEPAGMPCVPMPDETRAALRAFEAAMEARSKLPSA